MTTQAYHTASRELLAQGLGELERGDARLASGTGWDAAVQMVKAIAEARGWPHDSHRDLYAAVSRLVDETGDREIYTLINVAGGLEMNFHEDWYQGQGVRLGLASVGRLLDKLERLVDG